MTTTRPTFLPLIPEVHHMDSSSYEPGPIDRVTLNSAVESLSYHFVPGNSLGSEAQSLKATSIENEASVSQSDGTYAKQNKTELAPIGDMPTDSMAALSVKNHHDTASSPEVQKASQGTVATSLPTEFISPATNLKRRLVNTKDLIVCPGVYDGFSARIALSVGFDALYMVSNIRSRTLVQACSHHPDRRRHHGLSPWPARPGSRTAQRHACSCRHDRQP